MCCMTSATRKPSASQSRISTSSTGLSSRASDANRSATAAALSPRDTKTGVSCLARVSLVPAVMGPCAVRDFTMEWHYMERFGKSSFNGSRNIGQRLVQNDAFERVACIVPGRAAQCTDRVGITGFPAQANARRAEIDILGVVFIVQARCEQSDDMHACQAAILGQILHQRVLAGVLGDQFDQFGNPVAQLVHLTLSRDVTRDAARVLDVLVPVEHFPDRLGLWSHGIPHMHREDQ